MSLSFIPGPIVSACHPFGGLRTASEPKAKNLKSLGKDLVLVLKKWNTGKDLRPFAVAQGDNEKALRLSIPHPGV